MPQVEIEISLTEVARYLKMGRARPEGALSARIAELMAEARGAMRPARIWRRVAFPLPVRSSTLERHLTGCSEAYLVCGTLGAGPDALQRRVCARSGADALIVQAIGAAAIESWMDALEGEIRAELNPGETLRPRYSPGFGDFPLEAQTWLLSALDAPRRIGVCPTDSNLLVPSKSVTAVIGVTRADCGS